jgi:uncharacterized protein (TIGR02147 family)
VERQLTPSNVFSFSNYRDFLRDRYRQLKAEDPSFTHRSFSKAAGLGSPNYLKLVMDGHRSLGPKALKGFITGLRLTQGDAAQFVELVSETWRERLAAQIREHLPEHMERMK